MNWRGFFLTAVLGAAAGFIFYSAGMFLPWLLGPLFLLMILRNTVRWEFYWPLWLRNAALFVIGAQMGTSFTREGLLMVGTYAPFMIVMTLAVVGFTFFTAHLLYKWTNYSYSTALLGSFPGGLSQMVILGEEVRSSDPTVVALMQTIRIFLVITLVPFLVTHIFPSDNSGQLASAATSIFSLRPSYWLLLVSGAVFLVSVMKKLKLPIPHMLGALLAVMVLGVTTGQSFAFPVPLSAAAQVVLGTYLGLQMKGLKGAFTPKTLSLIVMSNLLLILFCIGLSYSLFYFFSFPLLEMFLSAAPGGVAEMAITAHSVGADVSTVTSFHLFRIFFILFLAAPLTLVFLKRLKEKV